MARRLTRKRILIIEDEYIVALNIASEVAARGGVVIGPVGTVDGALKAIKNADVDGAILDINLRGTASFAVADALANRHIPFVFATGYVCDVPPRHANVQRFEKPTPPSVIYSALEAAMSMPEKIELHRSSTFAPPSSMRYSELQRIPVIWKHILNA